MSHAVCHYFFKIMNNYVANQNDDLTDGYLSTVYRLH